MVICMFFDYIIITSSEVTFAILLELQKVAKKSGEHIMS